ncbi:oxygenase MpaB family protein [Haematomicrobium sanguinis]|uniref:oxygenase MpaB family protein n=1 Tax=Haematomicrobium sanguinis TaxID=479106 RepID=UPI000B0F84DB|nr:oxygenase MpaB family protein [Haematomicrobium sanguinis]
MKKMHDGGPTLMSLPLLARWRAGLRRTFSAGQDEIPAWVARLADGDDPGFFEPGSAVWVVHRDTCAVVGGVRALLMQALHPGALAGVVDHSRYKEDPLGRLDGTIRWVFSLTFGSTEAARGASDWVRKLHVPVRGTYVDAEGRDVSYSANDPHLARWVHLAFTDSFVTAHGYYGPKIPGGRDAYIDQWAKAAELMKVSQPPHSSAELAAQVSEFHGELRAGRRVTDVVHFLQNPPLPPSQLRGYRILFDAARASLPREYQRMLGVKEGPPSRWLVLKTRLALAYLRLGLGANQAAKNALARRARIAANPRPPSSM